MSGQGKGEVAPIAGDGVNGKGTQPCQGESDLLRANAWADAG